MHPKISWRLQNANAQFSAVVDAALNGDAQLVTRRCERAVVVLDAGEYERLRSGERSQAPGFIKHLLVMPRPANATIAAREVAVEHPAIDLPDVGFE